MSLAHHFSGGKAWMLSLVPEGRLSSRELQLSEASRPSGTKPHLAIDPPLKWWATFGCGSATRPRRLSADDD